MTHDRVLTLLSHFPRKLTHPYLFTIGVVQHCTAISAAAELIVYFRFRIYTLTYLFELCYDIKIAVSYTKGVLR